MMIKILIILFTCISANCLTISDVVTFVDGVPGVNTFDPKFQKLTIRYSLSELAENVDVIISSPCTKC